MKKMKKWISVVLLVGLAITLAGCQGSAESEPVPEDTAMALMAAAKQFDLYAIRDLTIDTGEWVDEFENDDSELSILLFEKLENAAGKMQYTVASVEGDTESARVLMNVTHADLTNYFLEVFGTAFMNAFELAFSGEDFSDDDMDAIFEAAFRDTPVGNETTETQIEIPVVMSEEGEWMVAELDEYFLDVLMSGFYGVAQQMEEDLSFD